MTVTTIVEKLPALDETESTNTTTFDKVIAWLKEEIEEQEETT